jgi:prepilin-type N-terminal cleavage/methylation domain-containing protein
MRGNKGFTLLELSFVVAIFTVVLGIVFTMSLSFSESAQMQNFRVTANDAARRVVMELLPELRQASRTSIAWGSLPADTLSFRIPVDTDGNGTAVNQNGKIELGAVVTVGPDKTDANNDGLTGDQLVRVSGESATVIVSGLAENATLSTSDSVTQVRGVWFAPRGSGIDVSITIDAQDRRGRTYRSTFTQFVTPRN